MVTKRSRYTVTMSSSVWCEKHLKGVVKAKVSWAHCHRTYTLWSCLPVMLGITELWENPRKLWICKASHWDVMHRGAKACQHCNRVLITRSCWLKYIGHIVILTCILRVQSVIYLKQIPSCFLDLKPARINIGAVQVEQSGQALLMVTESVLKTWHYHETDRGKSTFK